jgi:NADH dehydrogenase/NADH:ubiquinone oxidoreductase subunit G
MNIFTKSNFIRKCREDVLELLLLNHPLDCPVCDQAGECDLQDLSVLHGADFSRYFFEKKSILNKSFVDVIKTNMNRCIYCTKCVRYSLEYTNDNLFNVLGRGNISEIGNYTIGIMKFDTYINGNVLDLCPVGALTSKSTAYRFRAWELYVKDSLDILDSVCSNIRVSYRGLVLERVSPKVNARLNNEWITDKIRFCIDSFRKQRISLPLYKLYVDNMLVYHITSWELIALKIRAKYNSIRFSRLSTAFFNIFTGSLLDAISTHVLKQLSYKLSFYNLNSNVYSDVDMRSYYSFNSSLYKFNEILVFILIGVNTRLDSPIINLKLRHLTYNSVTSTKIYYFGSKLLINYGLLHLGSTLNSLVSVYYGRNISCSNLIVSKIVLSLCAIHINITSSVISNLFFLLSDRMCEQSYVYNTLAPTSNDVILSEVGAYSVYCFESIYIRKDLPGFIYLLGVDYFKMLTGSIGRSFIFYQGHHGDEGASISNVILPSKLYLETSGAFINCEGRLITTASTCYTAGKLKHYEFVVLNLYSVLQLCFLLARILLSINILLSFFLKLPTYLRDMQYILKLFLFSMFSILFSFNFILSFLKEYYSDLFSRLSSNLIVQKIQFKFFFSNYLFWHT